MVTLRSAFFLIPSVIIFCGITLFYWINFNRNTSFGDQIIYWTIYLVIMAFIQFVIYVNAKRNKKIVEDLEK